jgi:hypothetical protein
MTELGSKKPRLNDSHARSADLWAPRLEGGSSPSQLAPVLNDICA